MSEFESHVPSYKDSKEEMVEVLSQDLFPWQDLDAFLDAIENEDWDISCYELRRPLWAIQHLRGRSGSRRRRKLKVGAEGGRLHDSSASLCVEHSAPTLMRKFNV